MRKQNEKAEESTLFIFRFLQEGQANSGKKVDTYIMA